MKNSDRRNMFRRYISMNSDWALHKHHKTSVKGQFSMRTHLNVFSKCDYIGQQSFTLTTLLSLIINMQKEYTENLLATSSLVNFLKQQQLWEPFIRHALLHSSKRHRKCFIEALFIIMVFLTGETSSVGLPLISINIVQVTSSWFLKHNNAKAQFM